MEQIAGGCEDFPKRRGVQEQTEKTLEEPHESDLVKVTDNAEK
jgi:hypothetical protein